MDTSIKNICFINGVQYICRTCFDPGSELFSLAEACKNTQTWRDLLNEVGQLKTNENELLPKTICSKCLNKLISYYDFILQIQNVNKKYFELLANVNVELQGGADNFTDSLAGSATALPMPQDMTELKFEDDIVVPYDIVLSNSSEMQTVHGYNMENKDDHDPFSEYIQLSAEELEENKRFFNEEMSDTSNGNESSPSDKTDYGFQKITENDKVNSSGVNEQIDWEKYINAKIEKVNNGHPSCKKAYSSLSSSESDDELPTTNQWFPVKMPQYEIKKVGNRFPCPVCMKAFTLKTNCRHHIFTKHDNQNIFACSFCGHHSTCLKYLSTHLRRTHRGQSLHTNANKLALLFGDRLYSKPGVWRLVKCMLCNTIFSTTKQLRQHLANHSDIYTLYCLKLSSSIVEHWFPNMMDLNHVKEIICKDILEKDWLKYYVVLNEHSYEVSVSDTEVEDLEDESVERASKYNCGMCAEKFSFKYQVFSHLKEDHAQNDIPLKCRRCNLKFISIKMYEQHRQTYCRNKYKHLLCTHCPGKFIWPENMKNHNCPTKISTGNAETEDHQIFTSVPEDEKSNHDPFNECTKLLTKELEQNKRFLNEEMNDTGSGNESSSLSSSESDSDSELPTTSQSIVNKPQDDYEIKKVGNSFLCPVCKKTFTLRRKCRRHIMTLHCKDNKTFTCGFCGHHSTCKEFLSRHLKRAHPGESMHTNAKQLVLLFGERLYSVPTAWRLLKCMLCHAIFSSTKKLHQHISNHSDPLTLHSLELKSKVVKHWFPSMMDLIEVKKKICADIREKDWFKYYVVLNEYSYEVSISDTEEEDLEDKTVERARKYNCELCYEKFSYKYQVFSHLKEEGHDENELLLSCSRCKLKFISIKMYEQHKKTYCENKYKDLSCTHCPGKFIWPENMNNHHCPQKKMVHDATKDHAIFTSVPELGKNNMYQKGDFETDNDNRIVLPKNVIRCGLCELTFEKLRYLRQHMSMHADGKTGIDFESCIYVKQLGRSSVINYPFLKQQIKNAFIKRQISCFYQAIDKFGNEMDISDSDSDSNTEDSDGENVKKAYACDVCKDVVKERKLLLKHQQERHNTETLPFTCKDCQKQFVSIHLLQQHLKKECWNEHRRIAQPCDVCNIRFIWPNNMFVHKEIQHFKTEQNSTGCSKNFKNTLRDKKELERSKNDSSAIAGSATSFYPTTAILIKSSSADIELRYCFLCPKTFFSIDHLNAHLSFHSLIPSDVKVYETIIHSTWWPNGKKVIQCKICGQIFVTMAKLREHFSPKNKKTICTIEYHTLKNYSIANQYGFELHLELDSETEVEDNEEHTKALNAYNCCLCNKSFKRKYEITQHQRSMHNYELLELKCEHCIFKTVSQKVLDYHKATQCFNVEKNYKCDQCNFKFMWQENLDKHIAIYHTSKDFSKTSGDINRSVCEESTKTSNNNYHLTSDITTSKPFKCNLCVMAFPRNADLQKHHQRNHTGECHYNCTTCEKLFCVPMKLRQHLPRCQKSFNKAAYINQHMRSHNGDKRYVCNICGKRFVCASHLNSHKLTGHKELCSTPRNESNLNVSNEPAPREKYKCPICGVCLISKERLKYHMRIHTAENPYKCDICEKVYSRKIDLTVHRLTHSLGGPFKCTMCLKSFRKLCLLKSHMEIHTFEKLHECKICSKKFTTYTYLEFHMRNHTAEKPLT